MALSEQICSRCGHDFCSECVVFPFGVSKGAMCISCALEAGGVSKQRTGRPKLSARDIKRRVASSAQGAPGNSTETIPTENPEQSGSDDAWMNGEIDAESAGGWTRTF